MENGTPERNATSDANRGVVNPPSLKSIDNRQGSIRQSNSGSLNQGIKAFGDSLGSALTAKLAQTSAEINTRRVEDAIIRQDESELLARQTDGQGDDQLDTPSGLSLDTSDNVDGLTQAIASRSKDVSNNMIEQDATNKAIKAGYEHGINSIDKMKQRTGWTKAIFGENIEYRAAQQRAAQNAVTGLYLEQASQLDKFAGESEVEYATRLKDSLDKILEPYGNDPETKRLLTMSWMEASAKLTAKQTENHYAWNQVQQRETYAKKLEIDFDVLTMDLTLASSEEEVANVWTKAQSAFDKDNVPEGMDGIAARSTRMEAVGKSLQANNINAYNAAKKSGFLDGMTAQEEAQMDNNIGAFDNKFGTDIGTMLTYTQYGIIDAGTPEEIFNHIDRATSEVDDYERNSTYSERSRKIIADARLTLKRLEQQAKDAAAKKAVEGKQDARLREAFFTKNAVELAATITSVTSDESSVFEPYTSKDVSRVLDSVLTEMVSEWSGSETPLSQEQASIFLMEKPIYARRIAEFMQKTEVKSEILTNSVKAMVQGYETYRDPDTGMMNERGKEYMESLGQFQKYDSSFRAMVDGQLYDEMKIMQEGVSNGATIDMIKYRLEGFREWQGKADTVHAEWPLKDKESKQEYLQRILKDANPQGINMAKYADAYGRSLQMFGYDHSEAARYVNDLAESSAVAYGKYFIPEGRSLNTPELTFTAFLDGVQRVDEGTEASIIMSYLETLNPNHKGQNDADPATWRRKLDDVKGLQLYLVPGQGGFFMNSPMSQSPVHVTEFDMMIMQDKILSDMKFRQLKEEEDLKQSNLLDSGEEFLQATGLKNPYKATKAALDLISATKEVDKSRTK